MDSALHLLLTSPPVDDALAVKVAGSGIGSGLIIQAIKTLLSVGFTNLPQILTIVMDIITAIKSGGTLASITALVGKDSPAIIALWNSLTAALGGANPVPAT